MERIQEIQSNLEKGHFNAECEYEIRYLLAENKRLKEALHEILDTDGDNRVIAVHGIAEEALREDENR